MITVIIKLSICYLKQSLPREDYIELLIWFEVLGLLRVLFGGIIFKIPGDLHNAWWVAKGFYILTMYIFQKQFKTAILIARKSYCSLCFVIKLYVKAWFIAAFQNINSKLIFFKDLIKYKLIGINHNNQHVKCQNKKIAWSFRVHISKSAALLFFDIITS